VKRGRLEDKVFSLEGDLRLANEREAALQAELDRLNKKATQKRNPTEVKTENEELEELRAATASYFWMMQDIAQTREDKLAEAEAKLQNVTNEFFRSTSPGPSPPSSPEPQGF
jgi:hypothetical protein